MNEEENVPSSYAKSPILGATQLNVTSQLLEEEVSLYSLAKLVTLTNA